MPIREYLKEGAGAFKPEDIQAMSAALEEVCAALKLDGDAKGRETVAVRIIDLAREGERNPDRLRDRVIREASAAPKFSGL